MDSNSLELKMLSCKDLRAFNFFQKLSSYALVSIVSDDPNKKLERDQQHRTLADGEGDGNPEWNHEMRFDLNDVPFKDCDHLFLHFDLRHQGLMFGDKTIGEVRVPFKDLIEESNFGVVRFVSYQVRANDGKPNGVLSFSYKVNGKNNNNNNIIFIPTGSSNHDQIHYPTLELQNLSDQEPFSVPQQVHVLSPGTHCYPSHQTYYPPPDAYYPPPPPPPSMLHGAFYHPPPPPPPPDIYPWAPELYELIGGAQGIPGSPGGSAQSHGGGETWSNGLRGGRYRPASFWNGR